MSMTLQAIAADIIKFVSASVAERATVQLERRDGERRIGAIMVN